MVEQHEQHEQHEQREQQQKSRALTSGLLSVRPSHLPAPDDPRWLLKVAFSQRPRQFLASGGMLLGFICNATTSVVVGRAIDDAVATGNGAHLSRWLGVLALLFLLNSVSVWLGRRFLEMILQQVSHDVRTAVTDRIQDPRGIGRDGAGGADIPGDPRPGIPYDRSTGRPADRIVLFPLL